MHNPHLFESIEIPPVLLFSLHALYIYIPEFMTIYQQQILFLLIDFIFSVLYCTI